MTDALFIFLFSFLASAKAPDQLLIGAGLFRPFMMEENKNYSGVFHDYMTDLTQQAELKSSFEALPLPRFLKKVSTGEFDLFLYVSGIPEAQAHYDDLKTYPKFRILLISASKTLNLQKKEFFIGKETSNPCPVLSAEEEKNVRYYEYKTTEQAVKMLFSGRLDAICTSKELFFYELKSTSYKHESFFAHPEYHHDFTLSLFVKKTLKAEKKAALLKAAKELDNKKTLPNLYKKYGIDEFTKIR